LVGQGGEKRRELQHQLSTKSFRIYQGDDIIGVELGAAIKNVLAIGCGISDGLGFGSNAKGALITRGIVEMQRLGVKLGANKKTFLGLSGFGDLITTSISEESRNHKLGKLIGQGKGLKEALAMMPMVAEGVPTARAVKKLREKTGVELPICQVVYDILYNKKDPMQGLRDLMSRPLKNE
jgi:glycerol-3-phosphate dehydrogenase (NAD(P)+)